MLQCNCLIVLLHLVQAVDDEDVDEEIEDSQSRPTMTISASASEEGQPKNM